MGNQISSRRAFLKAAGIGLASIAAGCHLGQAGPGLIGADKAAASGNSGGKPNVLFIAVDDLRPQLNCFGHANMKSPNIDKLAGEGVIFSRAYCQIPVCGASRVSLLTGLRPSRKRFLDYDCRADEDVPNAVTLPEHFKNNGYYTVSMGKVFHNHTPEDSPESWSEPDKRPKGKWVGRHYLSKDNVKIAAEDKKGRAGAFESPNIRDDMYPDGKLADMAVKDLARLSKKDQPFFLGVGFYLPHLPFNAPKKYWDMYKPDDIDLADNPLKPKGAPEESIHTSGELRGYYGIPAEGKFTEELERKLVHGYYASTSYVDAQIGKVIDQLDRLGIRDNTIIVLWGDHGWNLGEHGLWCKHCNYKTSLNAPLIVSAPGLAKGADAKGLVEFIDIYPTLCDLAELEKPQGLHGASFDKLLKNPSAEGKEMVFSRWKKADSVKTNRFLYTEWTDDQDKVYARMLYDHKKDPDENINVAEDNGYANIVDYLSKALEKRRKEAENF